MSSELSTKRLRLYLIRHGEVEGAAGGRVFGRTDVALSETGIGQSRRLANKLARARLSAVYSSDLNRAIATAQPIAARHNLSVQINSAWREIDMGKWDGQSLTDIHQQDQELVKKLFEHPETFHYPGGESFLAFNARVQEAIKELVGTHPDEEIALVTHGGVTRAIIGTVLEMPMRTWLRLAQGYGCLNIIDWYVPNPVIQSLNFFPHTESDQLTRGCEFLAFPDGLSDY